MAPEIIERKKYQGCSADLFALGVILFTMRAGNFPFVTKASRNDPLYKFIYERKPKLFWWHTEKNFPQGHFSKKFKELVTLMLCY